MRKMDSDGLLLCEMQAELFEKSLTRFSCSSEIFIRRFTNSQIVKIFDNKAILDDSYSVSAILDELNNEYKELTYGSVKYSKNEMYWMGYIYRYFCYTYEFTMKRVYKIIKPKELRSLYLSYHTLSCDNAIERILESKNLDFSEDVMTRKGVDILRRIKIKNS